MAKRAKLFGFGNAGLAMQMEACMQKLMTAILLAAALAGCNTLQGVGKDVEAGGEAIQRAVKK